MKKLFPMFQAFGMLHYCKHLWRSMSLTIYNGLVASVSAAIQDSLHKIISFYAMYGTAISSILIAL